VTTLTAIGLAFLGGIILNLMPCVFPVLFLKGLALLQSSGQERKHLRSHGLVYTLGILVSFWVIVGVLLALRAGSSMATRIGISRIVARFGREPLIIASALAAAVSLGAIAFVHDVVPLAVLCVITGIGLGFGQPLSMTLIVQLVPDYARGTALAVRLAGNRVGQVAAPAAAGVVAGSAGARSVFWVLSALLGSSALAVHRAPRAGLRASAHDAEALVDS
jgi:MFS family permease